MLWKALQIVWPMERIFNGLNFLWTVCYRDNGLVKIEELPIADRIENNIEQIFFMYDGNLHGCNLGASNIFSKSGCFPEEDQNFTNTCKVGARIVQAVHGHFRYFSKLIRHNF
jgi:hypothetical protein